MFYFEIKLNLNMTCIISTQNFCGSVYVHKWLIFPKICDRPSFFFEIFHLKFYLLWGYISKFPQILAKGFNFNPKLQIIFQGHVRKFLEKCFKFFLFNINDWFGAFLWHINCRKCRDRDTLKGVTDGSCILRFIHERNLIFVALKFCDRFVFE